MMKLMKLRASLTALALLVAGADAFAQGGRCHGGARFDQWACRRTRFQRRS